MYQHFATYGGAQTAIPAHSRSRVTTGSYHVYHPAFAGSYSLKSVLPALVTTAILERALQAEMTDHLGYEKHDPAGHHRGNSRNGKSQKTLKGEFGELELETPRDRQATFDPKIVAKGQTRWTGFDDKIISMYARGMTTREIQGHLQEIYGIEVVG